jgi:hypothetical protein
MTTSALHLLPALDTANMLPVETVRYMARQEFSIYSGRYNPVNDLPRSLARMFNSVGGEFVRAPRAKCALSTRFCYPSRCPPLFILSMPSGEIAA